MKTWKYFKFEDFACKHCGVNLMKEEFIDKCDELRERFRHPLIVASGYRCPEYNKKVSTTGEDGPHTTGEAGDFSVSRHDAYRVLAIAMTMGFTGIGVQQKGGGRFLHLDTLNEPTHAPRPSVWSY